MRTTGLKDTTTAELSIMAQGGRHATSQHFGHSAKMKLKVRCLKLLLTHKP